MLGEWNGLEIFRSSLMTWLDPFERVEADDGYDGEAPIRVKCPNSIAAPAERQKMMGNVRRRQEIVNKGSSSGASLHRNFAMTLACMAEFSPQLLL